MATITITPGNSFTATEAVTSTKLNDLGSPTAALTAASIGTADIADDAITTAKILDANVTTAKILNDNVTTAKIADSSVTKAKMENISAPLRVLGRTTAGAGVAEEVTINNDNTMSNASASTLATDASIKQYVDTAVGSPDAFDPATYIGGETTTLPNGLIMKFGAVFIGGNSGSKNISFAPAFTDSCISVVYSSEVASLGTSYVFNKSKTGFSIFFLSGNNNRAISWQAFGY